MTDKELSDIDDEPELDDEPDLDENLGEDLAIDDDLEVLPVVDDGEGDGEGDDEGSEDEATSDPPPRAGKAKRARGDDEEDVLDLDEEHHPDDIEDPLDVLLQERTASASLEDDEEEAVEEIEIDDRGEGPTKIVPRRPGEFLCSSCFLVLPRNQLADEERMLCRDCA
jgi:hypothetical protein